MKSRTSIFTFLPLTAENLCGHFWNSVFQSHAKQTYSRPQVGPQFATPANIIVLEYSLALANNTGWEHGQDQQQNNFMHLLTCNATFCFYSTKYYILYSTPLL